MTERWARAARTGLPAFATLSVAVFAVTQWRAHPTGPHRVPATEQAGAGTGPAAAPVPVSLQPEGPRVVVYFFHRTRRCESCRRIEALASAAVQAGFPALLRGGRLERLAVAYDQPAGERYVQKYGLFTVSVVLVEIERGQTGRWKRLDDVWTLLGNERRFTEYVQREAAAFLGGP